MSSVLVVFVLLGYFLLWVVWVWWLVLFVLHLMFNTSMETGRSRIRMYAGTWVFGAGLLVVLVALAYPLREVLLLPPPAVGPPSAEAVAAAAQANQQAQGPAEAEPVATEDVPAADTVEGAVAEDSNTAATDLVEVRPDSPPAGGPVPEPPPE